MAQGGRRVLSGDTRNFVNFQLRRYVHEGLTGSTGNTGLSGAIAEERDYRDALLAQTIAEGIFDQGEVARPARLIPKVIRRARGVDPAGGRSPRSRRA